MPQEVVDRLWSVPVASCELSLVAEEMPHELAALHQLLEAQKQGILSQVQTRNTRFLVEETEKLDAWADDVKLALERELKELDREIREAKKAAKLEVSLEGKISQQRRAKALETARNTKRKSLFDAQDEIDEKRETLLETVEAKLAQSASVAELFTVKWRIV